jgi:hypothetical protein
MWKNLTNQHEEVAVMAKAVRIVGKPGASGTFLPTRSSGTAETGYYDPDSGGTVPRTRLTTGDARVGKKPTNKRLPGMGVGGQGESLDE